jgi:dihydroorotate dehydrogenase
MNIYKTFVRPVLFQFYPESVHNKVILSGKVIGKINNPLFEYIGNKTRYKSRKIETKIFNTFFENPIGLAAGFDKNAEIVDVAHYGGFGFEEVGSCTAMKNNGNEQIRIIRLAEDESLLNNVGLDNDGTDKIISRAQNSKTKIPYFINIAKTPYAHITGEKAIEDILHSFRKAYAVGNGIVINASCPNSVDGRMFEEQPEFLEHLLSRIDDERQSYKWTPVFLKLSPDIKDSDLEEDVGICRDYEINGFVAGNTAIVKDGIKTKNGFLKECGMSGKRLKEKSNKLIKRVYELTDDEQIIIGCGGIFSAEDAYEKIKLGSSLEEILTALPYEGNVVPRINKGLARLLERDGFKNLKEAVGYDVKV